MASTYDYVIVGDGIAARCVLHHLSLDKNLSKKSILQVASDSLQPACSLRTTSVVSSGLHQKGLSELGDLICDSLDSFLEYYQKFSPKGVYPAKQYSIGDRVKPSTVFYNTACFESDCFQIHADVFLDDLKARSLARLDNFKFQNDACLEINQEKKTIYTQSKSMITYDKLILCTGAYTCMLLKEEVLTDGKPVAGSYYQWSDIKFDESFVISKGHFNIIYRKENESMLFGGTSLEGLVFVDNVVELNDAYYDLLKLFPTINFPDIDKAQVFTGIRHKGKKRLPQLRVIGDISVLNCLYKNGFTFAFHLAHQLISKL